MNHWNICFIVAALAAKKSPPRMLNRHLNMQNNTMSTRWFLNSDWWKYWSPILPALIREMLPVGLDGSGHWVEESKDADSMPHAVVRWRSLGLRNT